MKKNIDKLIEIATLSGATDASTIFPAKIIVDEEFSRFCREPRCENFGLSPSCPPHVKGPETFRIWRESAEATIVVRLVVPMASLFSDERREVMALLHEIVAGVEIAAMHMGYVQSKAFAGGSCKNIFCSDMNGCRVLSGGVCRNPQLARPSMSGFGINVAQLMDDCGWPSDINVKEKNYDGESMSWVAGLVLIG